MLVYPLVNVYIEVESPWWTPRENFIEQLILKVANRPTAGFYDNHKDVNWEKHVITCIFGGG